MTMFTLQRYADCTAGVLKTELECHKNLLRNANPDNSKGPIFALYSHREVVLKLPASPPRR